MVYKIKEHIKNTDGTYDVVHRETEASLVSTTTGISIDDYLSEINTHAENKAYNEEAHGMRYDVGSGVFQVYDSDSGVWFDVGGAQLALQSMEITNPPDKTTYMEGEVFDRTGMEVMGNYALSVTQPITRYTVDPSTPLSPDITYVTINYTNQGNQFSCQQPISVVGVSRIEIVSSSTKTAYARDEVFSSDDFKVQAVYSNGDTADVTDRCQVSIEDGTVLSEIGTREVTVYYFSALGVTYTASYEIEVLPNFVGLNLMSAPSKLDYFYGETFSTDGLEIHAQFEDGSTRDITDQCVYEPSLDTPLELTDTKVTISFSMNNVTDTIEQTITVKRKLTSITISSQPSKKDYIEGELFSTGGMSVTANYNDGYSTPISSYRYSPSGELTPDDTQITISYTENGITVYAYITITIEPLIKSLSDYTWAEIAKFAEDGLGQDYFEVGDAKDADLGSLGTYSMMIVGFNHDTLESSIAGYNTSNSGKANMSFMMKDVSSSKYAYTSGYASMSSPSLHTTLEGMYEDSEVSNYAKSVAKGRRYLSMGSFGTTYQNLTENVHFWIPSLTEMGLQTQTYEGSQYAYYTNNASRIKYNGSTATAYLTRTMYSYSLLALVMSTGASSQSSSSGYTYPSYATNISIGFCI